MLDEKISAATELLSEIWRLNQFMRHLAANVTDEKLRKKISNQVARFDKKFLQTTQVFGLEVIDFTGGRFKSRGTVSRYNVIANRTLSPRPNAKTKIFTARHKSGRFFIGRVTKLFCNVSTRRTRLNCRNVAARNCSPVFKAGACATSAVLSTTTIRKNFGRHSRTKQVCHSPQ